MNNLIRYVCTNSDCKHGFEYPEYVKTEYLPPCTYCGGKVKRIDNPNYSGFKVLTTELPKHIQN